MRKSITYRYLLCGQSKVQLSASKIRIEDEEKYVIVTEYIILHVPSS